MHECVRFSQYLLQFSKQEMQHRIQWYFNSVILVEGNILSRSNFYMERAEFINIKQTVDARHVRYSRHRSKRNTECIILILFESYK